MILDDLVDAFCGCPLFADFELLVGVCGTHVLGLSFEETVLVWAEDYARSAFDLRLT
jgi:hypothetical protein